MMEHVYDLIIVGSGPAGITAGIYASRAELDFLLIEKNPMSGGQIINTYEVDNYPGMPEITGYDLAERFRKHFDNLGGKSVIGTVISFETTEEKKRLKLENGEVYETKTVIIAAGAVYRKLGVKGEEKYSGLGVSYCATCDGAFFRNKTVAVVGGGDVAVEDAIFLARLCEKVYIIHRRDEFRAAKTLVSRLQDMNNVEIIWNSVVEEIIGTEVVGGIVIHNKETNKNTTLSVFGVFIAVGMIPNSEVYKGIINMDEGGYLIADETCKTNVPGIYAAGDIRTKALKQVITAASDGANAITSVERYLSEEKVK